MSATDPERELYARRKNGSEIAVAVALNRVEGDGNTLILALIRGTAEHSRAEEDVLNIAKGVSTATGEMFFGSLVEHLARALQADHAFIGELMENDLERVRPIAVCAQGKIVDNFEYDLTHTPCRQVVCQSMCSYPSGVQRLFPEDRLLADMKVEGYVGTPLFDSNGRQRAHREEHSRLKRALRPAVRESQLCGHPLGSSSRVSCSATRKAPSRAPSRAGPGGLRWRTAAQAVAGLAEAGIRTAR